QAKHDIVAALQNLESVCTASGENLDHAGQMYDKVDKDTADRLDRTYPDPGGPAKLPELPGMPSPSERQAVMQTAFPTGRLTEPKKPDGFHNPIQIINDLGNMISPGFWALKFLEATMQVNPVQEFSNWIAGDWEQFGKAADALNSLSWFCSDVSQDLLINMSALSTQWTGNASNEAFQYFNTLGKLINEHSA